MDVLSFRRIALSLAGTVEGNHQRHPDFRVAGKVYATLGYPDRSWGMVILPPDEQRSLIEKHPGVFVPAAGAWGRQGSTNVLLDKVEAAVLKGALETAWRTRKDSTEASAESPGESKAGKPPRRPERYRRR